MAIITGYTAEKMNQFNNASVISGSVNTAGNLVLKTRGGTNIDAGNVKGPTGATGPVGITGGPTAARNAAFPLPTTVAASVTLANKVPTWYNTTTGLIETYYAKSGSSGLTVPGVPGAYGWYENLHLSMMPKGRLFETYTADSTGKLDPTGGAWYQTDSITVALVAGRRYRATYNVTSIAASGNAALGIECYLSSVTDKAVRTGTMIDSAWTMYVAPTAFQGKGDYMEFSWKAAATGNFLLKIATTRSTLTGYYYFTNRRLSVYDDGVPELEQLLTPL